MLFMNTAGIIWQLSVISGFVYLMMLCDLANAIIMAIAGSAVAYLAYYIASGGAPVPYDYLVLLPILAFVLFGVASLNYSNDLLVREKMQTANNIAAHVAHEMRTPLLGVKLDADRIAGVIPELLEGYNWAQSNGRKGSLARSQRDGIQPALQRITQHSESANVVIEMLLANAAFSRKQALNKPCSIQEIINLTLQRFNFRGNQRQLVTHEHGPDFMFMGSDVLMMHVLFNLMKNGLRAIERCGYGSITIRTDIRSNSGRLIFSDTGHGMSPDLARRLFMPFVTNEEIGVGNGIGLVFCRGVIDSFGGTIECASALGEGTTFTISVPIAH
jgi:two-component system CAI-1 autoinducer sensor kinase/phosphatase CqsS